MCWRKNRQVLEILVTMISCVISTNQIIMKSNHNESSTESIEISDKEEDISAPVQQEHYESMDCSYPLDLTTKRQQPTSSDSLNNLNAEHSTYQQKQDFTEVQGDPTSLNEHFSVQDSQKNLLPQRLLNILPRIQLHYTSSLFIPFDFPELNNPILMPQKLYNTLKCELPTQSTDITKTVDPKITEKIFFEYLKPKIYDIFKNLDTVNIPDWKIEYISKIGSLKRITPLLDCCEGFLYCMRLYRMNIIGKNKNYSDIWKELINIMDLSRAIDYLDNPTMEDPRLIYVKLSLIKSDSRNKDVDDLMNDVNTRLMWLAFEEPMNSTDYRLNEAIQFMSYSMERVKQTYSFYDTVIYINIILRNPFYFNRIMAVISSYGKSMKRLSFFITRFKVFTSRLFVDPLFEILNTVIKLWDLDDGIHQEYLKTLDNMLFMVEKHLILLFKLGIDGLKSSGVVEITKYEGISYETSDFDFKQQLNRCSNDLISTWCNKLNSSDNYNIRMKQFLVSNCITTIYNYYVNTAILIEYAIKDMPRKSLLHDLLPCKLFDCILFNSLDPKLAILFFQGINKYIHEIGQRRKKHLSRKRTAMPR